MRRLAIFLAATLLSSPAMAETASLLLDIMPSTPGGDAAHIAAPLPLLEQAALFFGPDGEMWTSDGTPGGTRPLRSFSSTVVPLGTLGRVAVFFVESNGDVPLRLWRTDGTRPGTFPILDRPERCSQSPRLESALVDGVLFFKSGIGCDLWRTDGTAAGTRPVQEPETEGFPGDVQRLTAWRGEVWFNGFGSGYGLWRSDGTAAGTRLVRSLPFSVVPRFLTPAGSRLFFVAADEDRGDELWVTDGTTAGTRILTHFLAPRPFPNDFNDVPVYFQDIGGVLHFLADDVTGGLDLWRSDGTEAGTRRVTAFGNARPFSSAFARQVVQLGPRLLFLATDGLTGFRLWSSGGTPQTTAAVTGCAGGSCPTVDSEAALVRIGDRAIFLGARPEGPAAVWSSDGTGSGTRTVRELCSGPCSTEPEGLAALLGQAYFLARGADRAVELWRTDGTAGGTLRLASLGEFAFFNDLFEPVAVRDRVLFTVDEAGGRDQLWASDGTPEGTGPITWFNGGGFGSDPHAFASDGGTVWFVAGDGMGRGLWRSAGTAAATTRTPAGSDLFALARGFAFFVHPEVGPDRLARTDGTPGGTLLLTPAEGLVTDIVAFDDGVVAVFRSFEGALSLWKSDGSLAGTRKLQDLPTAVQVIPVGPELFLIGDRSVWRGDGTPQGTREVQLGEDNRQFAWPVRLEDQVFFVSGSQDGGRVWRLAEGAGSPELLLPADSMSGRFPSNLAVFRGALYFLAETASGETGLWKSDGTAAGTVVLRVFPWLTHTSHTPDQVEFVAVGERLFFPFVEDQTYGSELWSTDGTPEGTILVRDIVPGPGSSLPSHLAAAGDRLFFAAADEVHGTELWETDGTEAGTRMVHDIAPGPSSSRPEELTVGGGHLFFSADDGVHGREPWVLPLAGPVCRTTEEALCLGGRFRVEAFWRDFQGNFGPGRAVSLTADTGYFWFFDPANVEVILKVLDGRGLNGHHWVFYGALSTVEYTLTVTDVQTGATRRYINPPGRLGSVGDTTALGPLGAIGSTSSLGPAAVEHEPITTARKAVAAPCVPSATRLCLQGGRFAVEADWRDFQGKTGKGMAVPLQGGDTGYFWFFGAENVEVVLKVLDGRPLNGKFWVFYGALSSVQYTLTVTDTETGQVKRYENPSGRLASVADTGAF